MSIQRSFPIKVGQTLKIAVAAPILVFGMFNVFPDQYMQAANTFTVNSFEVEVPSFDRTWLAYYFLKLGNIWSLELLANKQSQAALEIQSFLWTRGGVEGSLSLIFGNVFRRHINMWRIFTQVAPLVSLATDAEYKGGSFNFLRHNTFIMVFSKKRLDVPILDSAFRAVFLKCLSVFWKIASLRSLKSGWVSCWGGMVGIILHSFVAKYTDFPLCE